MRTGCHTFVDSLDELGIGEHSQNLGAVNLPKTLPASKVEKNSANANMLHRTRP